MAKIMKTISSWSTKKKVTVGSVSLACVAAAIVISIVISNLVSYKGMLRLKKRQDIQEYSYDEYHTDEIRSVVKSINNFSHPLFPNVNEKLANKENSAYSPASMFYALGMLSKVTSGQDKQNLLNILQTNEPTLNMVLPKINSSCNSTFKSGLKTIGKERLDNSIWLDKKFDFNEQILEELANIYYANSFSCDFHNENKKTNNAISEYAKESTEKLLNPKYEFDTQTAFVLLNTLFFEDVWNREGLPLELFDNLDFTQYDGSKKNVPFYSTEYVSGKYNETEQYKSMYARTYNGFEIKFIVPNDGVDVEDVYTEEILDDLEEETYLYHQEINDESYYYSTRIVFPEFSAAFDKDILRIFYESYDLSGISDFSNFIISENSGDFGVTSIVHTTKVEVTKDTVKGAAATAIGVGESAALMNVELNLIVDRPFVYSIKNPLGITLFEGVIYNI